MNIPNTEPSVEVDLTEPHEPIEGVDFDWVREIPVYDVPVEDLLSPEARELYRGLLDRAGHPISLNEVLERIAEIVKRSIAYDFNNYKAQSFYSRGGTVPEIGKNAKLKGVCTEGPPLAIALLNSLGIDEIIPEKIMLPIPFDKSKTPDAVPGKSYSHAVMGVGYEGGYKLVNTVSGKLPFGLITSEEALDACGTVPENLSGIPKKTLYASENISVLLQPKPLILPVIYDIRCTSNTFGSQLLLMGNPSSYPRHGKIGAIPFSEDIDLKSYPSRNVTLAKAFSVFRPGVEVIRRRFGRQMAQCIHKSID